MMKKVASEMCLIVALSFGGPAEASIADISTVIEGFIAKQFPGAERHFWVVNGTQWQTDNEVVVDLNTVVAKTGQMPAENRFLLLIVGGQLTAAQRIPLDAKTDCKAEET